MNLHTPDYETRGQISHPEPADTPRLGGTSLGPVLSRVVQDMLRTYPSRNYAMWRTRCGPGMISVVCEDQG